MRTTRIALVLALGLNAAACSNDNAKRKAKPAPTEAATAHDQDSAEAVAAVDAVMAPYEACRALLAADQGQGIAGCAETLTAAATAGETAVAAAAKPHLAAIAAAAGKLGSASTADLEAMRLAFGEVSQPVVALLAAVPGAGAKYRVFECPMAKGYNRWVQTEAKKANPYMGTQMLECGTEVH